MILKNKIGGSKPDMTDHGALTVTGNEGDNDSAVSGVCFHVLSCSFL